MRTVKKVLNYIITVMFCIGAYTPFILSINEIFSIYGNSGIKNGIIGWFFTICLMFVMVGINRFVMNNEKKFKVFDVD